MSAVVHHPPKGGASTIKFSEQLAAMGCFTEPLAELDKVVER